MLCSEEMSGFQPKLCTADAIMGLRSSLEDARFHQHMSHVSFPDARCAFDAHPYKHAINQFRRSGTHGRSLLYLEKFSRHRKLQIKFTDLPAMLGSLLKVYYREACLTPYFFKAALVDLLRHLP